MTNQWLKELQALRHHYIPKPLCSPPLWFRVGIKFCYWYPMFFSPNSTLHTLTKMFSYCLLCPRNRIALVLRNIQVVLAGLEMGSNLFCFLKYSGFLFGNLPWTILDNRCYQVQHNDCRSLAVTPGVLWHLFEVCVAWPCINLCRMFPPREKSNGADRAAM